MWMMGYTDGNMADSFNGRKSSFGGSSHSPNIFRNIHGSNLLPFNHHMGNGAMHEQNQMVSSSRWNPTREQLETLEELYGRGVRTPSADQIQHITAQLRRYGRIEGKNVFYWFQNHKARERHKRRRCLAEQQQQQQQQLGSNLDSERSETRESAMNRRAAIEVGQTKDWIPFAAEKSISMEKGAKKAGELQQLEKNDTWKMMQFLSPITHETNIVDNEVTTTTTTTSSTTGVSETLQLFPLQNETNETEEDESMVEKQTDMFDSLIVERDSGDAPCQFFEFLPLKN